MTTKTKTLMATIPAIISLTLCTACSGGTSSDTSTDGSQTTSSDITSAVSANETSSDAPQSPVNEEPILKHDNPRVDYTKDEVKDMINSCENLQVSDDFFYTSIPKTIDHVSELKYGYSYQLEPEEETEEFKTVFKYLFPDHEFDESCWLLYDTRNSISSDDGFLHLNDKDVYNSYINSTHTDDEVLSFICYDERESPREDSVSLYFRSPFGNDYCVFNKGFLNKFLANKNGEEKYYAYELYSLGDEDFGFETAAVYPPDSEEKFKLLDDKEISIKDAVTFFENYAASIPSSVNSPFGIHVNEVNVYKLDEEHYGFEMITSREFEGIPVNFTWDGTDVDGINRDMAYGIMVKTDDVDHMYGTFRACLGYDEVKHTDFIPFNEAVQTISEKMTAYVGFEVLRAELVYCWGNNVGTGDKVGEVRRELYPSWKLLLYNPNDDTRYAAFVNALTGEFRGGK